MIDEARVSAKTRNFLCGFPVHSRQARLQRGILKKIKTQQRKFL